MIKYSSNIIVFNLFMITSLFSQSLFSELNKSNINSSEVLVEIDEISITADEFFYSYEFGPAFTKRQKKSKEVHLDFMINEKLLALEGLTNDVLSDQETKSLQDDIQADIATEELFKDSILSRVKFSNSELNQMVNEKSTEVEIRWLSAKNESSIKTLQKQLFNGIQFDSLFYLQINDSTYLDERKQVSTIYNLRKKNPELGKILDTLKVGQISKPIFADEEWYIIKFDNKTVNILPTETEINRMKKESVEALTQVKMDSISGQFVNELLIKNSPIIKRDAFNIGRSYLGKFRLKNDNYTKWNLDIKLDEALLNLGLTKSSNYSEITLVELKETNYSLKEFITWFRNRNLYIKISKTSLRDFSNSLENLVWLMVRDKLLTKVATEYDYFDNYWVKKQNQWWKEKIAYSAYRKELLNSIILSNNEVYEVDNSSKQELLDAQITKKLFYEINNLRKKYKVTINYEGLKQLKVSSENDKNAINFYAAKNGGLIPRPPYPTIDNEWASWL